MGAKAAAGLHEKLVLRTLRTAIQANLGKVDLWCSPSSRHPFFIDCAKEFQVKLYKQPEGDLGKRMGGALKKTLEKASHAILIGTDVPGLTSTDLKKAATILKRGAKIVIGPAEDGGYVLIGMRQYAPELFNRIPWGTGSVMEETRSRLRALGWRWHELRTFWDVDRPEDVERLVREGFLH
jgi:rSAM/selenodomain-associated transferase 1